MNNVITTRWDPYFMRASAEFDRFWSSFLNRDDRNLLYVLGHGFDPRMCVGYESVLNAGGKGARDCMLLQFDEGIHSSSHDLSEAVDANLRYLDLLVQGRHRIDKSTVKMWSGDGPNRHRVGSRAASEVLSDIQMFSRYSDVVIDISSMPRSIYLSIIGKALWLWDTSPSPSPYNLHIIVCDNPDLDKNILDIGIDDKAGYVHGYRGSMELESAAGLPRVWIPILGEGQRGQLERIYTLVSPDEICPVLPSPSDNPRRSDLLIIEYRELLFDEWRIEPRNIIFASEHNPFEAYRQIYRTITHYDLALKPLGGSNIVLSAVSSKLLSLGAALAAYELKDSSYSVSLAHVETQGYGFNDKSEILSSQIGKLYTLWLAGECYD